MLKSQVRERKGKNHWWPTVVVNLCSIWIGRKQDDGFAASESGEDRDLEVGKRKACSAKEPVRQLLEYFRCDMLRVLRKNGSGLGQLGKL